MSDKLQTFALTFQCQKTPTVTWIVQRTCRKLEMARHKNRKKPCCKYDSGDKLQRSPEDKSCMAESVVDDSNHNSTLETSLNSADENLRSPESVRHESQQEDSLPYEDFSSEIIPIVPKINLNISDDDIKENVMGIECNSKIDTAEHHVTLGKIETQDTCFKLDSVKNNIVDENLEENLLEKTVSIDKRLESESEMDYNSWKNKCFNVTSLSKCSSFRMASAPALYKISTPCVLQSLFRENFHDTTETNATDITQNCENQLESSQNYFTFRENMQKPLDAENSMNNTNWYGNKQIFPSLEQLQVLKKCSIPGTSRSLECTNKRLSDTFDKTQLTLCNCTNCAQCFGNKEGEQSACYVQSCSFPVEDSHTAESNKSLLSLISPFDLPEPEAILKQVEENQQGTDLKDGPADSVTSVKLPAVSDSKRLEMELQNSAQYLESPDSPKVRLRILRWPFTRISEFFTWLVKNIIDIAKRGYTTIRELFLSIIVTSKTNPRSDEFTRIMTTIHTENEHVISVLTEKLTLLSEELYQVRVKSEATLAALTTEVSSIREASNNLVENNNVLTKELKSLHKALDNIQSKPPVPPPPPPPPPRLPSPSLQSTTLRTSNNKNIKTPTRERSIPVLNRPLITVEDLLKVKLKKAPQIGKENKINCISTPKGPVVSLDMLRNVKLKSARCRSSNWNAKSPKSSSRTNKSLPPTLNLSPIRPTAESSLIQILRQVDINKRGPKRTLLIPMHDVNNTSKNSF